MRSEVKLSNCDAGASSREPVESIPDSRTASRHLQVGKPRSYIVTI